jgi:lipopolysaccharide transport system ATP-binding protein
VSIVVDKIGKKFCRSLKRSMRYGFGDITRDLLGLSINTQRLRQDEFWAFQDVSFCVEPGECLGVIGPNGAGKSTILKLLAGIYPPDQGQISVRGRLGSLIEVGAGFHPLLSGRENIFINGAILGMRKREIAKKFDEIVAFSGVGGFIDSPVRHYSSGMFVRLGFAVAAHSSPEVLLIDEALAVGDLAFFIKCINRIAELRRQGTAVLFVSHAELQVRLAASRCLLLNDGRAQEFADVDKAFLAYETVLAASRSLDDGAVEDRSHGAVTISALKVTGTNGQSDIRTGDLLNLLAQCRSTERIEGTDLEIRIWSDDGQLITTMKSSSVAEKCLDLPHGEFAISIAVGSIPLRPGRYRFAGGFTRQGSILFWNKSLIEIEIGAPEGRALEAGTISLPAVFSDPQVINQLGKPG